MARLLSTCQRNRGNASFAKNQPQTFDEPLSLDLGNWPSEMIVRPQLAQMDAADPEAMPNDWMVAPPSGIQHVDTLNLDNSAFTSTGALNSCGRVCFQQPPKSEHLACRPNQKLRGAGRPAKRLLRITD